MIERAIAVARSTPVRISVALCGVTAVVLILRGIGWDQVSTALSGSAAYFPLVLALDACIVACSMLALRSLYGEARSAVPASQLVRAGMVGFAVQGLVPAGRAIAEVTRASLLARWVGAGRAAAAATRMQAAVLVAGGVISIPAAIAAALTDGPRWLWIAISIHGVVALALGGSLLGVARRWRIGAWLGRRFARAKEFGAELDVALSTEPPLPVRAIAWEVGGRCFQVVQNAVLIACVGGAVGLVSSLSSEGIHLVGAAVGDLVPAQLGVQEGNFTLSAHALGLSGAGAVAIALLAHLSQLAWVLVGSLVPLIWRPAQAPVEQPEDLVASAPNSAPRSPP